MRDKIHKELQECTVGSVRPTRDQPARAASRLGVLERTLAPGGSEPSWGSLEPSCGVISGGVEEPKGENDEVKLWVFGRGGFICGPKPKPGGGGGEKKRGGGGDAA